MTVAVPETAIKHDGAFASLKDTLHSICHRLYKMTLQRSVIDQVLAGIRHMASNAIMNREYIDQIVDAVRNFLRTGNEVYVVRSRR